MNNWYTADSHFGSDSLSVLKRDNRPFKDNAEYVAEQVRIWNEQASSDDTIYAIGDFDLRTVSYTYGDSMKK